MEVIPSINHVFRGEIFEIFQDIIHKNASFYKSVILNQSQLRSNLRYYESVSNSWRKFLCRVIDHGCYLMLTVFVTEKIVKLPGYLKRCRQIA